MREERLKEVSTQDNEGFHRVDPEARTQFLSFFELVGHLEGASASVAPILVKKPHRFTVFMSAVVSSVEKYLVFV